MSANLPPYIGPRPFERKDQERFFGRDREASELLSRVIAHPVVLLYAQSGAGKTSLINARLIPSLEREGFRVFPAARVRGQIPQGIAPTKRVNPYVFNVLMSWAEEKSEPRRLSDLTIDEFLCEPKRPNGAAEQHRPSVVVFDQFEELFTFYPERWQERHEFFGQICRALENDRMLRVVFVMREDYIAELDPYVADLPGNLRTRFRLEQLREEAALAAVKEPLRNTDLSFADGIAERLVNNLLKIQVKTTGGSTLERVGEFVEPVQLQVVCQTLWAKMRASGARVINEEHIKAFGDVDEALSSFYERCLQQTVQLIGVNEGQLRRWFEHTLITPVGTRGTVFRGLEQTGDIPNAAVDALEEQHLIRVDLRGGARWYELTHDRLIGPIKTSNQNWLLEHSAAEETRKWLEERAKAWLEHGRGRDGLLDEGELLRAKQFLDSPDAADVGYSDTMFALIQASRATVEEEAHERDRLFAQEQQRRVEAERLHLEEQRRATERERAARRFRWLTAALALACLVALGGASYAWRTRRIAEANAQKAEANAREAEAARKKAEEMLEQLQAAKQAALAQTALAATRAEEAATAQKIQELMSEAEMEMQNGGYGGAAENYKVIAEFYRQQNNKTGEGLALMKRGEAFQKLDNKPKAEQLYLQALNVRRSIQGPVQQDTATIHDHLAQLYADWGKTPLAITHEQEAVRIWTKTLGANSATTVSAGQRLQEFRTRAMSERGN
jgi:Tetratricopeptide repeat